VRRAVCDDHARIALHIARRTSHMSELTIAEHSLKPGEFKEININIARLPSHTQIETPIYVYRANEDGPTLALMAGMHGDEINGMEIVRRILDSGLNRVARGTVICMPIINMYGFLNYSREVPDGKDINRSFPGNKGGSLASRVAWHVTHDVIPFIDYGVDFHTGGATNCREERQEHYRVRRRRIRSLRSACYRRGHRRNTQAHETSEDDHRRARTQAAEQDHLELNMDPRKECRIVSANDQIRRSRSKRSTRWNNHRSFR
jgi:hypothetical protein